MHNNILQSFFIFLHILEKDYVERGYSIVWA